MNVKASFAVIYGWFYYLFFIALAEELIFYSTLPCLSEKLLKRCTCLDHP